MLSNLYGVWSAAPTPLTEEFKVDVAAVVRMVRHHIRLGVNGLFLAGTCGEGPWLPSREKSQLVRAAVDAAEGRLSIAVQVSDNSAARVLENIEKAERDGADAGIMAPPVVMFNADPQRVFNHYAEVARESPLPVGLYDLGSRREFAVPIERLEELLEHPSIVLVKDSSTDLDRRDIFLRARSRGAGVALFNGDEFDCVTYLQCGYDGLMLGGASVVGYIARNIVVAVHSNDIPRAQEFQKKMSAILYSIYGGPSFPCWLAGLKQTLVRLGVFSTWKNFPDFELTPECAQMTERVVTKEKDLLLPEESLVADR